MLLLGRVRVLAGDDDTIQHARELHSLPLLMLVVQLTPLLKLCNDLLAQLHLLSHQTKQRTVRLSAREVYIAVRVFCAWAGRGWGSNATRPRGCRLATAHLWGTR
jgi:hypothetical protein